MSLQSFVWIVRVTGDTEAAQGPVTSFVILRLWCRCLYFSQRSPGMEIALLVPIYYPYFLTCRFPSR